MTETPPPPVPGAYQQGFYPGPEDPLISPDFNGWWNRAMRLLSANWRPLAMIQLMWAIPLLIVSIIVNVIPPESVESGSPGDLTALLLITLPFTAVAFLLGLIATLATLHLLVQYVTGRPVSVGDALRAGLRRSGAMLGWGILGGLMILVGFVLCILPGIYVALVFTILPAIVLLERGNPIARSFQLVHAQFGPAAGRILTIAVVGLGFMLAENALTSILGNGYLSTGSVSTGVGIITAIVSVVISVISGVVTAPLTLTAYADMRARREPFATSYLTA
nr:hypothetical protein [uncultured Actinoplanes sp.]